MCEKNIDLMTKYMDGCLDDFEKMNLEKHIEACEVCAEDFKAYSDILQGFEEMEMVEAPENFASSVMEQVRELDLYSPAKVKESRKSKVVDGLIFAGFGLAAIVVFGGGALALFGGEILSLFYGAEMYGVAGFVAPIAEACATIVGNIVNWTGNLGEWSQETLVLYGVAFLAVFAVLVLLQINMSQKPSRQ